MVAVGIVVHHAGQELAGIRIPDGGLDRKVVFEIGGVIKSVTGADLTVSLEERFDR